MYSYRRRNKIGAGSIFFIVILISIVIGLGYLLYLDKGKFWDILPLVSIPCGIISLILTIFNLAKKTGGGYVFLLFFLVFLVGAILSSIFGPFAVYREAEGDFEAGRYQESIDKYQIILRNYPNSKFSDSSLERVSYAYYQSGNYSEAITYFNKSIQKNVISPSDLEVEKVLAVCYFKLGEEYYTQKYYAKSAESYLGAAKIQERIRLNFPDTNEAFVASYRIPEYLFKAALSYKNAKDWDKATKILEEIATKYSESEFFSKANSLLSDVHIEKSIELKNNYRYRESIEEFLKVLDLDLGEENKNSYMVDYYSKEIFYGVELPLLKDVGQKMRLQKQYEKALFVYNKILELYPESEEVIPYIIECKVELISASAHTKISQPESSQKIYSPGKSRVIIRNETEYNLVVYFRGSELKLVEVEPESEVKIEVLAGTYEVAAELTGKMREYINVLPFYGVVEYKENQRYKQVYSVAQ